MKIKREDNFWIVLEHGGSKLDSQSVEVNLLFEILEALKAKSCPPSGDGEKGDR